LPGLIGKIGIISRGDENKPSAAEEEVKRGSGLAELSRG
jgi:hypothetical protein